MAQLKPGPPPQSRWHFTLNVMVRELRNLAELCCVVLRSVLHATVGMVHQARPWSALHQCHAQGLQAPAPLPGVRCSAQPMQRREKASSRNARYDWVEKGAEMADIYVTVARSYGTHKRVVSVTSLERFE